MGTGKVTARCRKRAVDKQGVNDWINQTRVEVHGEHAFTG